MATGTQSGANEPAPYLKLSAGLMQYFPMKGVLYYKSADKKQKVTPVIEVGAGYNVNNFIKVDIFYKNSRLSLRTKSQIGPELPASMTKQKVQTHAVLTQIYLSLNKQDGSFAPFFVAGCGVGYNHTSNLTRTGLNYPIKYVAKNTTNFVWTAGTGIIFSGIIPL